MLFEFNLRLYVLGHQGEMSEIVSTESEGSELSPDSISLTVEPSNVILFKGMFLSLPPCLFLSVFIYLSSSTRLQ